MFGYQCIVPFPGAVQTISKLMREEKTRAASITMLGATAQLCSEQVCPETNAVLSKMVHRTFPVVAVYPILDNHC